MLVWPLDSTRYVEFDFCMREIGRLPSVDAYLDVSSPRLLPTLILRRFARAEALLVNPDKGDLPLTRQLLDDLGLSRRCTFTQALLGPDVVQSEGYDLVTCMSVLEHIPDDAAAVRVLWDAVRPGGRLLLTVPCQAQPEEQYMNVDPYGLLGADEHGIVFRQRLYSKGCLECRVFAVTGPPVSFAVWGERKPGYILNDTLQKWGSLRYPFWSEPLRATTKLARYSEVEALPGEGVACMAFLKEPTRPRVLPS